MDHCRDALVMSVRLSLLLVILLCALARQAGAEPGDSRHLLQPEPPVLFAGPLQRLLEPSPGQPLRPGSDVDPRQPGFLALDAGSGLSLLCDSPFGLGAALSDLARQCLLGRLDEDGWTLGRLDQVTLSRSLSLEFGDEPLRLDFGLSWLDNRLPQPATALGELGDAVLPATLAADVRGASLQIGATRWLGERSWLRVTGQGSALRIDRRLPGLAWSSNPLAWDAQSLRIDAGLGDFSGSLTGRRTSIPQFDHAWVDLDLGVSWRTPWSGRLTVGARNLLSAADAMAPQLGEQGERLIESRTPYVRYQQDL